MRLLDAALEGLPIEAPAGYFESFARRVTARIGAEDTLRAGERRLGRWRPAVPAWGWAAVAALLVAVATPWTLREMGGPAVAPGQDAGSAGVSAERRHRQGPLLTPGGPTDGPARSASAPVDPARESPRRQASATTAPGVAAPPAAAAPRVPPPAAAVPPAAPLLPSPGPAASGAVEGGGRSAEMEALADAPDEVAKGGSEQARREAARPGISGEVQGMVPAPAGGSGRAKAAGSAADVTPAESTEAARRIAFAALAARRAHTLVEWRRLRDDWAAFVRSSPPGDALTDDAAVRLVEAAVGAARVSGAVVDVVAAREAGRDYLGTAAPRQRERVLALLAGLP